MHAVIPHMLTRQSGSIVNLGSTAVAGLFRGPYATAKGGIHALTAVVGRELATTGIRVNCVAPHATEIKDRVTPRNTEPASEKELEWRRQAMRRFVGEGPYAGYDLLPMKRWGNPEEQASAIAFLASDDASFMTGQIVWVGN
jgi:dihydroxycyclohexadiene carboxylate dehydrogenase